MSNGFKEMLDDAIDRNIKEIKLPIENEIGKIFSKAIDELNLVRKSELEDLIRETFKNLFQEKKNDLKLLIKEALTKELIQKKEETEESVQQPPKLEEEITLPAPQMTDKRSSFPQGSSPSLNIEKLLGEMKEFISLRKFTSKNQLFRGLAYFLTKKANILYFNIKDLRQLYQLANIQDQPNFGITAQYNVKSGFFEKAPEKKDGYVAWKITEKTIKEFE